MIEQFKSRVSDYAGREFMRKSVLSIRDGAGVIERVLKDKGYKRALEIGTYRGVSTALIAQFCETVVTIDLVNGKMERDHQVFDRVRLWEALDIPNIDLRLVCCDHEKTAIVNALDFDFAFVDGDHDGDGPAKDFELVKRCGAVLFHDYGGDSAVTRLVDSLPDDQVTPMDIFALWLAPKAQRQAA